MAVGRPERDLSRSWPVAGLCPVTGLDQGSTGLRHRKGAVFVVVVLDTLNSYCVYVFGSVGFPEYGLSVAGLTVFGKPVHGEIPGSPMVAG